MISYAQNCEDVVLGRVFRRQKQGFYVDIGGWDPVKDSVTKHFYDQGWIGVNVEPVKSLHATFEKQRRRDTNLCVAIGKYDGETDFVEWNGTGLSTVAERFDADQLRAAGYKRAIYKVPMMTLATLCRKHATRTIDFLKIDVEGLEKEVIESGDWKTFRPRVVLVEAIKPIIPGDDPVCYTPTWDEWEPLLLNAGYRFALFDGLNRFYHRSEEPALMPLLSVPANVRDGFIPAKYAA